MKLTLNNPEGLVKRSAADERFKAIYGKYPSYDEQSQYKKNATTKFEVRPMADEIREEEKKTGNWILKSSWKKKEEREFIDL